MNKPKIIFIINSIQQQRCLKRINEFIDNGYEVEAYGFSRSKVVPTLPDNFQITVLDEFDASVSYAQRMIRMLRTLRPVLRQYRQQNVILYYFLLDVAMVCRLLTNKPYIYEESDLMQTEIHRPWLCRVLNVIDRWLIRHSLITVQTSEGFGQYHFGDNIPSNVMTIPNRLNPNILNLPILSHELDCQHLRFAFVGGARYKSTLLFAQIVAKQYPQHSFHFYGTIQKYESDIMNLCSNYANIVYHGPFANPTDLPSIYSQIDVLVTIYDITAENVRYAEPNKLYEACYFETPIIVTADTFLSRRVEDWGIGFAIDGLKEENISLLIDSLTETVLTDKQNHCHKIPKKRLINKNSQFFDKLEHINF